MEHGAEWRIPCEEWLAAAKGANALQQIAERGGRPLLKELVVEASRALARLDAERLEELALSCQALNRELAHVDAERRAALAVEAGAAAGDMAVFARVLEATRANLSVMRRLRELRAGSLEYGEGRFEYREARLESGVPQAPEWRRTESGHGDN
jgi:hypothetical protein